MTTLETNKGLQNVITPYHTSEDYKKYKKYIKCMIYSIFSSFKLHSIGL